ncbi:MAG: peptidoglycan-binding protein [Henriciella sp.]|uniref:peptidoglycan-binding protein n=1 Tax=Henriciella sp. TaxID=1968823 RepID=UPI0032EF672D
MSNYGPWSVKGIDQRAREAAREAAREEGLTIGEYINRMLLEETAEEEAPSVRDFRAPRYPRPVEDNDPHGQRRQQEGRGTFDQLIARLEAVEARSTLALTGIDQSIVGLVARLNKTDAKSDQVAENVDTLIDDLTTTHEQLQDKLRALEEDETGARNLESLKSLEKALGQLAGHIHEESARNRTDSAEVRSKLEAGLDDIGKRVSGMEEQVGKSLQQAEARSEGTTKHLADRLSDLETNVASKLSRIDQFNERMGAVEGDVAGALTSIESVMTRMQERLHRAEETTNSALQGLEQTFNRLDERIDDIAKHASPEAAAELRSQFESRFDGLAADLRGSIETAREELAREIEQAASAAAPEQMQAIEESVDSLQKRMSASEERSSRALEGMTSQVGRISSSLDRRLREVESRDPGEAVEGVRADMDKLTQEVSDRFDQFGAQNDEVIDKITDQMKSLADRFDDRVEESEQRSANAIEQVGEQVSNVAQRLQARQERAFNELKESMDSARKQQSMRLSDALSGVSDRIDRMQQQQASAMSPVQKAIASLATRLEALEDFTTPPHAETERHEEPDFAPPAYDHFGDAIDEANALRFDTEDLPEEDAIEVQAEDDVSAPEDATGDDIFEIEIDDDELLAEEDEPDDEAAFEAGVPDISELDDLTEEEGLTEDATADASPEFMADLPEEPDEAGEDPLAELGGWEDAAEETRDSDIFGDDDEDVLTGSEAFDDEADETEDELVADTEEEPVTEEQGALEEDREAMDYLSRARKAAMAATADPHSRHAFGNNGGSRGKSRIPLVAAVSVVALATAAAGTFITLRGLQEDPGRPVIPASEPVAADQTSAALPEEAAVAELEPQTVPEINPLATAELAGLSPEDEAAVEDDLFEEEAAITPEPEAAEPAAPAVDFASLPEIPKAPTLETAASEGNSAAQLILGEQRLDAGDYTSGPSLVRKSAEAGEPAAQYRLAKLHERGLGVPKDLAAARQWTERAAEGGNVKAMHDLAVYYAEGEGGQQSYAAAVEWFRKAADYGLTDSQYNLAVLYEAGLGISPSPTEALYWYEVAHNQGDEGAIDKVEELRAKVSLDAAQQAQRRAATWMAAEQSGRANGQFDQQAWQGASTEQVRATQTVLNALGYEAGRADGVMGAGTRAAITSYQQDANLQATGSITPETVATLNELVAAGAQTG